MPRLFLLLVLVTILLFAGGVSAAERSDAELSLAQASTAVQTAERDDAARYAADDLVTAHSMLSAAQDAFEARAWTDSAIYAERARVDGDLAAARSRQHRAEAATAEIERSLDTLRAQLASHGGAS